MMLTSISMPRGSFHPPADVVVEVLFGTLGSGHAGDMPIICSCVPALGSCAALLLLPFGGYGWQILNLTSRNRDIDR